MVIRLGVDYNKISIFARFVSNDLHGSANVFGFQVFRGFPVVKPINRCVVRK
jgi:hypothetical protein